MLFIIATVTLRPAIAEERWYEYWPAVVTVKGFIVLKRFYGGPGFGETPEQDYKSDQWLLLPSPPIDIRAASDSEVDETLTNVWQVQLAVFTGKHSKKLLADLRRYRGQEVVVTGKLYSSPTVWYWTKVAMEVDRVVLAPRSAERGD